MENNDMLTTDAAGSQNIPHHARERSLLGRGYMFEHVQRRNDVG